MELHWSHENSGKHGAAGEGFSTGDTKTITKILERNPEDDFECTYFRQRPNRTSTKESIQQVKKNGGLFPITIDYNSELSDGYTDSDSESDNTSNVERWLESLPANDAWSSTPNYLALDGSEGLEGVDEIQEDSKKTSDDDSSACSTGTDDWKRGFISKTEDSKVRNNLAKRTYAKRDEVSATSDRIDRQTPHKKMERTLKMRQKIPLWTEIERKARIIIAKEKFLENKVSEEADMCSLISESDGFQERNISNHEKTVYNSLKPTIASGRSPKKPFFVEESYNDMMQEMVHELLNDESMTNEIVEKPRRESLLKLCEFNESKENIDDSRLQLGMKRARLSSTYKNLSPKLAKTKINDNHLSKRKRIQGPNWLRNVSQGRKSPATKHQGVKSVGKLQCVEDIESGKTVRHLKCPPQCRSVRFQDEVTTEIPIEAWKRSAMARAARNKQILQTVEHIVDNIGDKEEEENCRESDEERRMLTSVSGLEGFKDGVESKIYPGSWEGNRKRPMNPIENKTIGSRKPTFTNPFVENCLNKAMEVAMSKYKCPQNTWENFIKEKTREIRSTAYEPPAKKLKPKSSVPRQDFSSLNSWQSIHNHFLLYSSCK